MVSPVPNNTMFQGPFQPMRFEATVDDCVVTQGEIPKDIAGGHYRVGPQWKRPTRQGTNGVLQMDGMVQGLVLDNGKASFRNRWIRTPKYMLEEERDQGMFEWADGNWNDLRNFGWGDVVRNDSNAGIPQGTNGINVFPFAGAMVAAGEQGGPPSEIDPITLETRGIVRWSKDLVPGIHKDPGRPSASTKHLIPEWANVNCAFTAHPKWDHDTGQLYGWSWSDREPYLTVSVVSPDGTVVSKDLEGAPYSSMVHDMWLTEDYIVLPIQPWIASAARADAGHSVFDWDAALPMVLAIVPRRGFPDVQVRYLDMGIEPECVMHTLASSTQGNVLSLDGPIFNRPPWPFEFDFMGKDGVKLFFAIAKGTFGRWTVDLDTGRVTTERLNDRPCELPKIDERFFGKPYRYGYMVGGEEKGSGMSMTDLVKYDRLTGTETLFRIRGDKPVSILEPAFIPRSADSAEGDGYVLVPVTRWTENRADYLLFDADDITVGPIATIEIPFHSGWTPHGHWMDFR